MSKLEKIMLCTYVGFVAVVDRHDLYVFVCMESIIHYEIIFKC